MINIGLIGADEAYFPFFQELQDIDIFRISLIFSEEIDCSLKRFAESNNIYLTNKFEELFSNRFKLKLLVDTTGKKKIIHRLIDMKPKHISIIDIHILQLFTESIMQKLQLEKRVMLSQRYETIGTLVSGICHEINNILMIIMGYAQLASAKASPDISNHISGIIKSCQRAGRLIEQLSSFRSHQKVEKKRANIVPLVKETIKFTKETIPENIKIRLEMQSEIHEVEVDLVSLRNALLNLIGNSQEAMPEGGEIYVRLYNVYLDEGFCKEYPFIRPGEYVCISLKDTGAGIPKELLEKIFDPFFSTKDLGRGLGLSYVYGIIKQHGGYILVDSEYGKGAEFKLYLPALNKREEIHKNERPKNVGGSILIVEDEKDLLKMIHEFLKTSGYNVLSANNAGEAFKIIEEKGKELDLIITDFILPDSFGSRVAYMAKKKNAKIKTILMTGYQNNIDETAPDEFFDMVIPKPISMAELTNKISELIKNDN